MCFPFCSLHPKCFRKKIYSIYQLSEQGGLNVTCGDGVNFLVKLILRAAVQFCFLKKQVINIEESRSDTSPSWEAHKEPCKHKNQCWISPSIDYLREREREILISNPHFFLQSERGILSSICISARALSRVEGKVAVLEIFCLALQSPNSAT